MLRERLPLVYFLEFSLTNFRFWISTRPGTPLRMLGLMWTSFRFQRDEHSLDGRDLDRLAVHLHYLALINRVLDKKKLSWKTLLRERREAKRLGMPAWVVRHYLRSIRDLEAETKSWWDDACVMGRRRRARFYREKACLLIFHSLCEAASLTPYVERDLDTEVVACMCAFQCFDDWLDRRIDERCQLVSFFSTRSACRKKKELRHLRLLISRYLRRGLIPVGQRLLQPAAFEIRHAGRARL